MELPHPLGDEPDLWRRGSTYQSCGPCVQSLLPWVTSPSRLCFLQFIHSFMSMIEAINIIPIDARQKNDARKSQPWSRDDMIDTYQSSVPTLEILISFFQLHSRQLSSLSLSFSNSPSLHRPFFGSNPFFPTLKHPPASF